MPDGNLRLRIGQLNDRHAHVAVYDNGGHAGALVLNRQTWNAIEETGDFVANEGDYVEIEVTVTQLAEGLGAPDPESRRSIARGKESD